MWLSFSINWLEKTVCFYKLIFCFTQSDSSLPLASLVRRFALSPISHHLLILFFVVSDQPTSTFAWPVSATRPVCCPSAVCPGFHSSLSKRSMSMRCWMRARNKSPLCARPPKSIHVCHHRRLQHQQHHRRPQQRLKSLKRMRRVTKKRRRRC